MERPTLLSMPLISLSIITSSTIFFFFIIIVVSSPTSYGANDDQFTTCSQLYDCGGINGIGYPFWGGDRRPSFCGVQGFELRCNENDYPTIDMENQTFRVLHFDESARNMTIARIDMWDNICPNEFSNTTLNFNLFDYGLYPQVVNISLFYGCSFSPNMPDVPVRNKFPCPVNDSMLQGGTNTSFFLEDSQLPLSNYAQCKSSIKVPVFGQALKEFWSNESMSVLKLVKEGFGVEYHEMEYFKACEVCNESGGICGTNNSTNQPTCFCPSGGCPNQGVHLPCEVCNASGGICWTSSTNQPTCFCPSGGCPNQGGKKQLTRIIVTVISTVGAAVLVTCAFLIFYLRKKSSSYKSIFFWRKSTIANDNVEAFLKTNGSIAPKRYSYSSIKKITNSFQDKLGQGGYGGVFKGQLLDKRLVAVKLLNQTKDGNGEEFINEVASISRTSHVNIVSLVGYCFEGRKRALIYEYMPNGSLEKFIYSNKPQQTNNDLDWKTMQKIAVGVARGLEYLHRGCATRIFHFDIKPHNILLDEDFCPKISDFGLAKLCPKKESIVSMLHARGTVGYIAPEVFSRHFGRVSHKADVYSYGMLVLEMVQGRENIDESIRDTSELYFPHSIYKKLECKGDIGLRGIESAEDEKVARKMILVGLCCIQANPLERPTINKVIEMLEGNLESLQVPPEPFLFSPLRSQIVSSTIQISEENESCEIESM